jgi:hypothetical protein
MILYCTTNRDLEVWLLDVAAVLARPPLAPTVYALVSFEAERPRYYVGSSTRLTARLGAHLSFARSTRLRGHSGGGRLLAPVVARRRRALVVILETCPGASFSQLQRREQAWILAGQRDNGAAALPYQVPVTGVPERGPQAPAALAAGRAWPSAWVGALAGFFREPRTPAQQRPATRADAQRQAGAPDKAQRRARRPPRVDPPIRAGGAAMSARPQGSPLAGAPNPAAPAGSSGTATLHSRANFLRRQSGHLRRSAPNFPVDEPAAELKVRSDQGDPQGEPEPSVAAADAAAARACVPQLIPEKEVERRWPYFADKELRRARQRGEIAYYGSGKRIFYEERDVAQYLQRKRRETRRLPSSPPAEDTSCLTTASRSALIGSTANPKAPTGSDAGMTPELTASAAAHLVQTTLSRPRSDSRPLCSTTPPRRRRKPQTSS